MALLSSYRRPGRLLVLTAIAFFVSFLTISSHWMPDDFYGRAPFNFVKSSYDWANRPQKYPVASFDRLPSGTPHQLAKVQYAFSHNEGVQESRRRAVKTTFNKCWTSYREYAWGYDELQPISLQAIDTFSGWGATLVDALDALWIMGMKSEFDEAIHAVVTLDWDATPHQLCSLFETNIRYLGGLLAAYELSGEPLLLSKAAELGHMLYNAFDTPNRMPANSFNFKKAKDGLLEPSTREVSASIGSLSLEFTRLSQLTGDPKFFDAVERIKKELMRTQDGTKLPGMWPTFLDVKNGFLTPDNSFTLGSMADSLYEYLPKMYALLGGLDDSYKDMHIKAMETAKAFVLFRPMLPDKDVDILFSGTVLSNGGTIIDLLPQTQHLACFTGGMFALGGKLFDIADDVRVGEQLTRGCAWAYQVMPQGVMPEEFAMLSCKEPGLAHCEWDEERWKKQGNNKLPQGFSSVHMPEYLLRPEAIESVFYMYRMTGDSKWQDIAWEMFESIKKATETRFGHSAIKDVTRGGTPEKKDSMEVSTSSPAILARHTDRLTELLDGRDVEILLSDLF